MALISGFRCWLGSLRIPLIMNGQSIRSCSLMAGRIGALGRKIGAAYRQAC
jgi:hypothetical protein